MSTPVWAKALHVIPRLDKDTWDRLGLLSRWLVASRAAVLILTLTSAMLGGLIAYRDGRFHGLLWLLAAVGLVLAHATNNMVNDLTDSWTGVDKDNYFRTQYGPQPLEHGLMTVRQLLLYAALTGLVALGIGGFLVWVRADWTTAILLGTGVFFVLFYTYPLKHIGLGEPAVLAVWGPLMVGGAYHVAAGQWSWDVAWISLPYSLATAVVIFGKHIDKIDADRGKGVRTLPVLLGPTASRYVAIAVFILQYLSVAALVALGVIGPWVLLVALALPTAWTVLKAFAQPRPEVMPEEFRADIWPLWYVALGFWHTRRFGVLYVVGVAIEAVAARW